MITLEKLNKYYNKNKKNEIHVIDNTNLKMPSSGLVCLLGASGSGKTTLLNVIGGLEKVNKGSIYINNQKITQKSMRKVDKIRNLNIGYIFQDYKLIDNLTVFDNVALVLKMIGIKDEEVIKKRVKFVLDTLNIYRYRNRPAGALSGGERQRVGIARAIVKDPDILLADEPTGNLDSRNTIEIMNIIKSISKTKLVILVTHEVNLAKFYASRIIEIEDGKVVNDYENSHNDKLDYIIENNIYLKDIKNHSKLQNKQATINYYNETDEDLDLVIVVKNGNIYLKTNKNEKIEVIDQNSNIELIDDHYKEIDQETVNKYSFDFDSITNYSKRKKYSSILNPITLLINGFKRIKSYSFLKKLLLLGYVAASMFVLFSISRITAAKVVKDEKFIKENRTYLLINTPSLTIDKFNSYTDLNNINYAFPGSSLVQFDLHYDTFMQNYNMVDNITGSISNLSLITKDDIYLGTMPVNDDEVVIDKLLIDDLLDNEFAIVKMTGTNTYEKFIGLYLTNVENKFKIVGISNKVSPSIYVNDKYIYSILHNNQQDIYSATNVYSDYSINDIKLKKGRLPINDYEALIGYDQRYFYSIGSKLDNKINNTKLKVVGYYETKEESSIIYVNSNMIKYDLINKSSSITISSNNKDVTLKELNDKNLNAKDLYLTAREDYIKDNKDSVRSVIIFSSVIIAISLIEILLMVRSSFLSQIKEVGIYRAIGVKKSDIYKMFLGEILAISLTASLLGNLFMSYILYNLTKVKYINGLFVINLRVMIISYIICLLFNIVVGLIPVANTIRKRPATILARHDI